MAVSTICTNLHATMYKMTESCYIFTLKKQQLLFRYHAVASTLQ